MLKEFKAFALRGNALDLAVGVVLGIAFGAVVNSLVGDVIMNLIAAVGDQPDFTGYVLDFGGAEIRYGSLVGAIVNFLIVSFALFLFVKALNKLLRPKGAEETPEVRECPYCKESIPASASRCRACTSELQPASSA